MRKRAILAVAIAALFLAAGYAVASGPPSSIRAWPPTRR